MAEDFTTSSIRPVRFDATGDCVSPKARSAVLAEAARTHTNLVVFAHGWNNTWPQALGRFRKWRDGTLGPECAKDLNPLMIGLYWPSTWLTFAGERGPALATATDDFAAAIALLPVGIQPRMRDALKAGPVPADGARQLAEPAASTMPADDISGASPDELDAEAVLQLWAAISGPGLAPVRGHFGTAGAQADGRADVAAFPFNLRDLVLDPRDLVRLVSVWTMHDRARTVGRSGIAALLSDLLDVTPAPVHLVGHSYGCQLFLAAVREMRSERKVESALLLQPAVNYLCFSARLPGGAPAAYRSVLPKIRQPLLSTYSKHDFPLTKVFHRAFRRRADVGEVAAWPLPPSPYAALGGYGPGELGDECLWEELLAPATGQEQAGEKRVHALDGSAHISGHGDVTNDACCGLLRSQLRWAVQDRR